MNWWRAAIEGVLRARAWSKRSGKLKRTKKLQAYYVPYDWVEEARASLRRKKQTQSSDLPRRPAASRKRADKAH